MTKNTAMTLFTLGLVMTFGGVGAVEHSIQTVELTLAVIVSGVGLLIMWVGTEGLKDA